MANTRKSSRRSRRSTLWTALAVCLAAGAIAAPAALGAAPATQPVTTQTPELTFAPLVSLHSSEPIAPMSVDEFLRNSRLFWAFHSDCPVDHKLIAGPLTTTAQWRALGSGGFRQAAHCGEGPVYTTADRTRPYDKKRTFHHRGRVTGREGFYLDLDQDALGTRKLATVTEGGHRVLEPSPVYFERHDEADKDGNANVRFTYWFFYPFSTPTGDANFLGLALGHEGDWERISVLARRTGPDQWLPLWVRFHSHAPHTDLHWKDVLKAPDDTTHPRVFVSKGSHATYPRPGKFPGIPGVDEEAKACLRCPFWFTWTHPKMLVDATQQPWYGFGGAWGRVRSASGFTGPLGPSRHKTLQGRLPPPDALPPAPPTPPAPG
jgi:hypothetical protein